MAKGLNNLYDLLAYQPFLDTILSYNSQLIWQKKEFLMVKVEFLGPIGKENIEVDVKNLKELKEILSQDSEIKEWLKNSAVAVNDKIVISLDIELKDGDRVAILPPVCGG
jgi:molybdopterin synthase sulfur carrier subunit